MEAPMLFVAAISRIMDDTRLTGFRFPENGMAHIMANHISLFLECPLALVPARGFTPEFLRELR
jgi:hypothetical protein